MTDAQKEKKDTEKEKRKFNIFDQSYDLTINNLIHFMHF